LYGDDQIAIKIQWLGGKSLKQVFELLRAEFASKTFVEREFATARSVWIKDGILYVRRTVL
jgi:hypothetical protein